MELFAWALRSSKIEIRLIPWATGPSLALTRPAGYSAAQMRLLDRYLLRELLIPLGYCLGGFLVFWIAFDLFSDLGAFQQEKLKPLEIGEY